MISDVLRLLTVAFPSLKFRERDIHIDNRGKLAPFRLNKNSQHESSALW